MRDGPWVTKRQLEIAAAWASDFKLEEAPEDVLNLSKLQIANILAAMFAGSCSHAGRKIWSALKSTMQNGPCTVIPNGRKVSLWDALYINTAFASALELDDFHYRGHLGQAVVVAPLALAEFCNANNKDVLRAQIVANELAGRLGWAITAEIRHGHQRSYLLRLASAAAAGIILNLSQEELTRALAIAMTLPDMPLHPGMFSPDTKVLAGTSSVVEGVRAAFLAQQGFSAPLDILENRAGFYKQFTMQRNVQNPFVQFGESWCTHALCFKRYAACAYAAGAVDAAISIRKQQGFNETNIDSIEIVSSIPSIIMERLATPHEDKQYTAVNIQFSIIRCVAVALVFGELRGFHFSKEAFPEMIPHVRRLEPLSKLVHDWKYTVHQLSGLDDGLNKGGSQDSADMLQFYRTSRVFRSMFGSIRAISPADIVRIFRLPAEQRSYFLNRWKRSIKSHLGLSKEHKEDEYKPLGDLRKLSFRMSARVIVRMKDGKQFSAEQIIPTGMAGDPDREKVVKEKLFAEAKNVIEDGRSARLWNEIMALPNSSIQNVIDLASNTHDYVLDPA